MAPFGAGVFKWLRPVFLCSSRKSAYFMPVYLEILNFKRKRASQVRKFSALLCMGRCKSQGSLNPILYILATWGLSFCFLSVSLRFTTGSSWSGCHLRTARRQAFPFPRAPWLPWKGCNRWLRLSGLPSWSWMTIIWETFHDQLLSHGIGWLIPVQSKYSWYVALGVKFWTRPHQ